MDSCIEIENFRKNLIELIGSCGLSIGTVYYVLRNFFKDFEEDYKKAILEEINIKNKNQEQQQPE